MIVYNPKAKRFIQNGRFVSRSRGMLSSIARKQYRDSLKPVKKSIRKPKETPEFPAFLPESDPYDISPLEPEFEDLPLYSGVEEPFYYDREDYLEGSDSDWYDTIEDLLDMTDDCDTSSLEGR